MSQNDNAKTMDELRSYIQKKVNGANITIPVLSKVAQQVFRMSQDRNTGMAQLADLIHRDQALAGHLLKVANSAAIGAKREIASLNFAVQVLGTNLISEFAMAIIMNGKFYNVPDYKEEARLLMLHSIVSAQISKGIASKLSLDKDNLYLCGLIHGVGKPVILQLLSDSDNAGKSKLNKDDISMLIDEFHLKIGSMIFDKWQIPDSVTTPCLNYKNYSESPEYKKQAAVTYLSNKLANVIVYTDDDNYPIPDEITNILGLEQKFVDNFFAEKEKLMEKVNAMAIG